MKPGAVLLLLGLSAGMLHGQAQQIIKQRARDLSNQNNERQGVSPAAPPAKTPTPAPSTPPPPVTVNAQQQSYTRLRATLDEIKAGTPATPQQKERMASDLAGISQGIAKPSKTSTEQLAEVLASALSSKPVSASQRTRLLERIRTGLVLDPSKPADLDAVCIEVQRLLQGAGVDLKTAGRVSDALKTAGREIRKAPAT